MKSKLPMVDINGEQYLYDLKGKRLLFANDPTKSISFEKLKNDSRYLDFFELVDGAKNAMHRAIVFMIKMHALLDIEPTKEEKHFLNVLAKSSIQSNQVAVKSERSWLKRKFKW